MPVAFQVRCPCPLAVRLGDRHVNEAVSRIDLDTIGKILLTSVNRTPKVLNTHRMMVSNQVSLSQIYSFLRDEPPVLWTGCPESYLRR